MKAVLIAPIRAYQRAVSPLIPRRCKYHPTCSAYAVDAIREFGAARGVVLAEVAPAAVQPVEPRRRGLRPRPAGVPLVNPLKLLEDPLRAILDFLHENGHLTYGWSIVVLTVLVRTAMLPLVIKQYSSMRSMQMVAPQLKELQRKYKGNRQKLQEETMAFYKQNEINPFASCLPLVAQIPIFIALYYVLKNFAKDATVGRRVAVVHVAGRRRAGRFHQHRVGRLRPAR